MSDLFKDQNEKDRELRIGGAEFVQAAEVARLAVALAGLSGTKPEEELHHAWQLIESARDIVAPIMPEIEAAARAILRDGGNAERLTRSLRALEKADMIPYEGLIGEPGGAGQKSTPISYSYFDEKSGTEIQQTARWRKLTLEGFRDAVVRFADYSCRASRKTIDTQLAEKKPLTEWFQRAPHLSVVLDAVEKFCGDVPLVVQLAKNARPAIEEAMKNPDRAMNAERMVFQAVDNAKLHEPKRRKSVLDQWEKDARTESEEAIMRQLQKGRALPIKIVWQINESRHRGTSERSRRGAATKRKQRQRR